MCTLYPNSPFVYILLHLLSLYLPCACMYHGVCTFKVLETLCSFTSKNDSVFAKSKHTLLHNHSNYQNKNLTMVVKYYYLIHSPFKWGHLPQQCLFDSLFLSKDPIPRPHNTLSQQFL